MLLRHSAIYFIGRLVPALINMLALAVFTRLMGAEGYGRYALIITSAGIVSGVLFQWLSLSMARYLPDENESAQGLISTAVIAFFGLLLVSAMCGVAAAWMVPDRATSVLILLSLVVTWAQAWFDLNQRIANARFAAVLHGMMGLVKSVLALAIGVGLFWLNFGIHGVVAGLVIALLAGSLLIVRQWREVTVAGFDRAILHRFVAYGGSRTLTFAMIYIIDASDRYFIGWYQGMSAVGMYAPAYDLAQQTIGMIMGIVHLAAFPLAVKAFNGGDTQAVHHQIRQNGLLLMMISLPATVGLALLSDNVAALLFGQEIGPGAGPVISIVAAAVFTAGVRSYYYDYSFQLSNQNSGQLWAFGWAAATNVVLNILLIPPFGLQGAAISTLAAFLVSLLVTWHLGRRVFAMPPLHPDVAKVAIASGVMAIVLLVIRHWTGWLGLIGQVMCGACVYALLLLALDVAGIHSRLRRPGLSQP